MPGIIITVAQRKGGSGKTTIAAQLAVAWARSGFRVAAIDIDPQASLAGWHALRAERLGASDTGIDFAALSGWRATRWAQDHATRADFVIIDGPPHAEAEARAAIRIAGLVIVPAQPSPLDLWASKATLQMAVDERRPAVIVLNRVPSRSALTQTVAAELQALGGRIAASRIGNRVGLAHAMASGMGVVESGGATPAASEIQALADEIASITSA